jgi:ABC-type multidrug transport system permease subunit
LTLGLAISRGPAMLLLAPLALGMVCMITAWTYCLRGWLATLMTNPRRRRTVVMVIMLTFILIGQAPNLYFNVFRRFNGPANGASSKPPKRQSDMPNSNFQKSFEQIKPYQKFIPPLWLPLGAEALAEGQAWPALLGTLGCVAIGALGLRRAYRSTLLFYRGDASGKATSKMPPKRTPSAATIPTKAGRRFLELRLPGVPEQATALALATFRSLLRAPEVKIAWGSSILVPIIVGVSLLFRGGSSGLHIPAAIKPFAASGAVLFSVFMLVPFFANQFGFDRDGFRALVLSPVDRRLILLGKNLASLPVGGGFGLLLLVLISLRLQLPPSMFVAALLQLATLLLLAALVGNMLSILVPYRIQQGSMKPTKMPALAMVILMLCNLLFPVAMAPVFLPPLAELIWQKMGWSAAVPMNLILSILLLAGAALAYWQTLVPLGQMLQRRETKILGIVTVEVD